MGYVHGPKKGKEKIFLLKVDYKKAFDSINWGYLDWIMKQMGFSPKWRRWIHGCLSSSRATVLINRSPSDEFTITKGVQQGDPLSSFIFYHGNGRFECSHHNYNKEIPHARSSFTI